MRAQLIEFTPESRSSPRNPGSLNIALSIAWQSSNVPSTAMLWTLPAPTVVICRRWTSETRPAGWRMKIDTRSRPLTASMAAEPVSPEVAPTMVTCASCRSSTWS